MIDDLEHYKPSMIEISEVDYCAFSLLYYRTTETFSTELARGGDFADIVSMFWRGLSVNDLVRMRFNPNKKLEDQDVSAFFFDLIHHESVDIALREIYWQFCLNQTNRFSLMRPERAYLLNYFFPVEVETEIEGKNLIGRPDCVYRIPGTEDRFYINDDKTSLEPPTWKKIEQGVPVLRKTRAYYRVVRQVTGYHIIKTEHGWNCSHGTVSHYCPYDFNVEPFQFNKRTINNILKVKVPKIRALYALFRTHITDIEDEDSLREVANVCVPKRNPFRCQRCNRQTYCVAAAY